MIVIVVVVVVDSYKQLDTHTMIAIVIRSIDGSPKNTPEATRKTQQ